MTKYGIFSKENLKQLFKECMEISSSNFHLLYIDFDNLKDVNDLYGHTTGDTVIARVSDIMLQELRSNDLVIRGGKGITYASDEFIVLLPDTSERAAKALMQRLYNSVNKDKTLLKILKYPFSISIGGVKYNKNKHSLKSAIQDAETMMYIAKREDDTHLRYCKKPFERSLEDSDSLEKLRIKRKLAYVVEDLVLLNPKIPKLELVTASKILHKAVKDEILNTSDVDLKKRMLNLTKEGYNGKY